MLLSRALTLLAAAAIGCSSPPVAEDAGRDAGPDAGRDAGTDAGRDAGRAEPRDSGVDAGSDGGDDAGGPRTAWERLPGMPDECPVKRAVNPELLYQPRWEPCPEQPDGCLRQVHVWDSFFTDVGWHDGTEGYVYMGVGGASMIVGLETGTTAAWSAPSADLGMFCSVDAVGIGDGYGAMYAVYFNDRNRDLSLHQVYHAPLTEIGRVTEPVAVRVGGFGSSTPQHVAVSRSLVAAEI